MKLLSIIIVFGRKRFYIILFVVWFILWVQHDWSCCNSFWVLWCDMGPGSRGKDGSWEKWNMWLCLIIFFCSPFIAEQEHACIEMILAGSYLDMIMIFYMQSKNCKVDGKWIHMLAHVSSISKIYKDNGFRNSDVTWTLF